MCFSFWKVTTLHEVQSGILFLTLLGPVLSKIALDPASLILWFVCPSLKLLVFSV